MGNMFDKIIGYKSTDTIEHLIVRGFYFDFMQPRFISEKDKDHIGYNDEAFRRSIILNDETEVLDIYVGKYKTYYEVTNSYDFHMLSGQYSVGFINNTYDMSVVLDSIAERIVRFVELHESIKI